MTFQIKTVLVTGGYGFIGSNFIKMILSDKTKLIRIINLDAITYAANTSNLPNFTFNDKYWFVHGRIEYDKLVEEICVKYNVDGIINFAAESHVDRSIENSKPFLDTNVVGTVTLLEIVKKLGLKRFLQVSTDEVYGSLDINSNEKFTELSPLKPNSPYAASKASADCFVRSYYETYKLPVVITRCSNNYGPNQFTEKLIPLMITNAIQNKPLPIYGDGQNVRDWIHVDDHCRAIWNVYENGIDGEVYNIGTNNEWKNIDIVELILSKLNKPKNLIQFVEDRLGHDKRYSVDSSKIQKELGWKPEINFSDGIESTIQWYVNNKK